MKPKPVRHVAGGEQKVEPRLDRNEQARNRRRAPSGQKSAAVIESNTMASATLTAINAQPASVEIARAAVS